MIGHQLALIRREIWEHRAIYVTPIAIAVIVSLISLAGMVTVSAFDKEVSVALFSARMLRWNEVAYLNVSAAWTVVEIA